MCRRARQRLALTALAALCSAAAGAEPKPRTPMPVPVKNSALARWLAKPVTASVVLDDMEDAGTWRHLGPGRMSFPTGRCRSGDRSIRLESPTKLSTPNPTAGRPFGEATLRRVVNRADWRDYNRLSLWVYPDMPGHRRGSVLLKLTNDGPKQALGPWVRGAMNHVLVEPGRWNHVVWEIAHLRRDRVTALDLIYRLQGNEPGAAKTVRLDFDRLELQKVRPDHFAGWSVAPGRIAFCHSGYARRSPKIALASGLKAKCFDVMDPSRGGGILGGPVHTIRTPLGEFQVLDFTVCTHRGEFYLQAGSVRTRRFRIGPDPWRGTISKVANFFYCLRCGAAIPGLHGLCHADLTAEHNGRRIVTNGGWHDAGDLSQGSINTAEGVGAMLALAERLAGRDEKLRRLLIDEAIWGLRWLHKTRFGDGFRVTWQTMDFWTDNRPGGGDDVTARVEDSPYANYIAARASAAAARVLKKDHPQAAAEALRVAREDWTFAERRAKGHNVEMAAEAVLAAVELYRATRKATYAGRAVELAKIIVACQQRTRPDWAVPLTGFFYRDAAHRGILNYFHRGHDQSPAVALAELCRTLGDHADWITWYASVALHSQYLRATAELNRPYRTLGAGVYRLADNPKEVALGVKLSETHCLRRFPVAGDWRGHFGVLLSQTKALAAAARLRGRKELANLVEAQLQWVVGRNPFCQSTMTGEGYDFAPLYTPMCGEIVGALPVGIQYRGGTDAPYWPPSNCWVYKEVWVHPASRWLWILSDLEPPATRKPAVDLHIALTGETRADGSVTVRLTATGRGRHTVYVRAWNLDLPDESKTLALAAGTSAKVAWSGRVRSAKSPWVAVACVYGFPDLRTDVIGSVPRAPVPRGKLSR